MENKREHHGFLFCSCDKGQKNTFDVKYGKGRYEEFFFFCACRVAWKMAPVKGMIKNIENSVKNNI